MNVHNYILWKQFASSIIEFDSVMKFFLFGGIHLDWTQNNYSDMTWKHQVQDFSCQNSI